MPFLNDNCSIYNYYGPAECTEAVLGYKVTGNESINALSLPIGRPIVTARIYLLDKFLQEVIPGQIAEIVIGGNFLSTSLIYHEKFS